jgi:hypothetical protein
MTTYCIGCDVSLETDRQGFFEGQILAVRLKGKYKAFIHLDCFTDKMRDAGWELA